MYYFKFAFRKLFQKGEHTPARLVSLIAGISFGLLLLSEVFYDYSFDDFYPDHKRIYTLAESIDRGSYSQEKHTTYPRVSGAIAPGLKAEVPGVEAATRLNSIGSLVFYTENNKSYKARFSFADEHLFEVLPRPVIYGNSKEILTSPMECMVSSAIANQLGGNVIGKVIDLKEYPNRRLTIAGIFKALPENTNYKYDVLIAMVSTGQFIGDGTNKWSGNDRYAAYVKLAKGVTPSAIAPAVREMQGKHQDLQRMKDEGVNLTYTFTPLSSLYVDQVKGMVIILSTIALAVLFVSLMNYILLTLSTLVKRAKTSAVYKTCGAQEKDLHKMIFTEAVILFAMALIGAFVVILIVKPFVEAQAGHQLISVLTGSVIWPLLGILIVVLLLIGYLPGRFFARIPVATAFRAYRQRKDKWKPALLSVQFIGASFILTTLVVVSLQYHKMLNADHGYHTAGIYYGSTSGMEGQKINSVLNRLRALPGVNEVALGQSLPIEAQSGNNITSKDLKQDFFNIADFYFIDQNYLSVLGIKTEQGESFSLKNTATGNMLISRKGADLLAIDKQWKDGVVGKEIRVSEHGVVTITGVFSDFIIQSLAAADTRPAVFFYASDEKFIQAKINRPSFNFYILVKTNSALKAGMKAKIAGIFNEVLPYNDASIKSLADEQQKTYQAQHGFKNAMIAGNVIILLITIIGLLGYTSNEATRRQKELAIRKINGAKMSELVRMFVFDLEYLTIPATAVGLIAAWFMAKKWMQNFADKIDLGWTIFLSSSLFIVLLVTLIGILNYSRIANRNPVDSLRYE